MDWSGMGSMFDSGGMGGSSGDTTAASAGKQDSSFGSIPDLGSMGAGFLFGTAGAQQQNRLNRSNMQWAYSSELDASNTAMQRRVADLSAAGLNPMLAVANQQPASTPNAPVGAPAASGISQGVASAYQGRMVNAEVQKAEAEASSATTQAAVNAARLPQISAETRGSLASAGQLEALTSKVIPAEIAKIKQDIVESYQRYRTSTTEAARNDAQSSLLAAQTRLTQLEGVHSALGLPRARAESWMHGTDVGQRVLPWVSAITEALGGVSSAAGAYAGARIAGRGAPARTTIINQGR